MSKSKRRQAALMPDQRPNNSVVPSDALAADARREYRVHLIKAAHDSETAFDRTLLSLSGGALGVSFAFVKDFLTPGQAAFTPALLVAWIAWAASLGSVLASHFFSAQAMRKAIRQLDDGTIYTHRPGGRFAAATFWLNISGGLLFIGGVFMMGIFVTNNLR